MSRHEYPITKIWYTKYKGKFIEEIANLDFSYLCWMIRTFQDLTPTQAQYIKDKYGVELKPQFIQDVEPYVWQKGDPDELYMELCETKDLKSAISRWRAPKMNTLF